MSEFIAYRSTYTPPVPNRYRVRLALAIVAAMMISTNAALAVVAWLNPSAGGMIFFLGIWAANFSLLVASLGVTPFVKTYAGSISAHLIESVAAPVLLSFVNMGLVGSIVFPNGIPRC